MAKLTTLSSIIKSIIALFVMHTKSQAQLLPFQVTSRFLNPIPTVCNQKIGNLMSPSIVDVLKTFTACAVQDFGPKNQIHPETGKTTDEIITMYGYNVEIHTVTTEDGYILSIHRIPNPGKTPIYLQHGLGASSDNWVLISNNSLAFILADVGYDVWLGNFRGCRYSLGHTNFRWDDVSDFSYWNFSFHENGKYDIPSITQYITQFTEQPKLIYIGYSMGTTAFFVALDQIPDFVNEKLSAAFLLAPIGFISRTSHPIRLASKFANIIGDKVWEGVFKGRIGSLDELLKFVNLSTSQVCTPTITRCGICDQLFYSFYGLNPSQMNYTNMPNVFSKLPDTMSTKSLYHFSQSVAKCTFAQFDYGTVENWKMYGQSTPPEYNLSRGKVPVYAFYGDSDNLCHPEDARQTLDLLPDGVVQQSKLVDIPFSHSDFAMGLDVVTALYNPILEILRQLAGRNS